MAEVHNQTKPFAVIITVVAETFQQISGGCKFLQLL